MFESLYEIRPEDKVPFGKHWMFPERFSHGEWVLVAVYPKDPPDGDGYEVRLHEMRMPTRFYMVWALPGENSVGEAKRGFILSTGSGERMLELAVSLAEAASQGMIGWGDEDDVKRVGSEGAGDGAS